MKIESTTESFKKMQEIDCHMSCKPLQYKFWYWTFDMGITNIITGETTPFHPDFHVISGQTDANGEGPHKVISKNGARPVLPPELPEYWKPYDGQVYISNDPSNTIMNNIRVNLNNMVENCYCSNSLQGLDGIHRRFLDNTKL